MADFFQHRNETRDYAVGFARHMTAGQTLSTHAVAVFLGSVNVSLGSSVGFTVSSIKSSTAPQTGVDGFVNPAGQSVVFTLAGADPLTEALHDLRVTVTLVETSEVLIAQDSIGEPPTIQVRTWAETT